MYIQQVRISILLVVSLCLQQAVFAQAKDIEGLWLNQEKSAKIRIYKAKNDKYYGKIDWLKEPLKDGKARVDENNTEVAKKNEPLIGLVVLKGFTREDDKYEDGTIYDPKNGKTYSCIITPKGDKLDVRGYMGVTWIGRTAIWTKAD